MKGLNERSENMPPGRNYSPGRDFGMWFQNGRQMGNQPRFRGPGGFPFQNRPPMQYRGNNMFGNRSMPRQGGGGLLSKLLGRSKQQGYPPASMFFSPSAPQAIAKSSGSLTSILANTQKVLSAAEQIGPMVQQYGPLIKNLPAMWKIYRSMKDSEDSTASENENPDEEMEVAPEPEESTINDAAGDKKQRNAGKAPRQKGDSLPKLYI
jgi:hypothetical protein